MRKKVSIKEERAGKRMVRERKKKRKREKKTKYTIR